MDTIAAAAPSTRHWCALSVVLDHFGSSVSVNNTAGLRELLGKANYGALFRGRMGAVEQKLEGSKQLFIPGSQSDYPLKDLMGFLIALSSTVNVRLLVASHDESAASTALIGEHGGRGGVGRTLQPFRAILRAFLSKHAAFVLGKESTPPKDGEQQLVRVLKELGSCGIIKGLTSPADPLAWVRRDCTSAFSTVRKSCRRSKRKTTATSKKCRSSFFTCTAAVGAEAAFVQC